MAKQTLHAIPAGTPIKSSGFLSLNLRDFTKGAVLAVLGSVGSFLYMEANKYLQAGIAPNIDTLKTALAIGAAAFGSYLLKNLFTDSKVVAADKSVIKA